ncbi:MAG: hypothetical protein RSB50_07105 [Cetobacterium sp.]
MKAKHSGIDNQGKVYTDCSECKKGGNGDSSCSKVKKPKQGMCFRGELLDKFEVIE